MSRPRQAQAEQPIPPVLGRAVKVEAQNRVRLPRDVVAAVSWLREASASVECLAITLGSSGGLLICPETAMPRHLEVLTKLQDRPITVGDTTSRIVECARMIATRWNVVVSWEKRRFSLALPRGARDLKVAPSTGQTAFVFAAGEILEVWPGEEWVRHVRPLAARMWHVLDEALEDLVNDSGEE